MKNLLMDQKLFQILDNFKLVFLKYYKFVGLCDKIVKAYLCMEVIYE